MKNSRIYNAVGIWGFSIIFYVSISYLHFKVENIILWNLLVIPTVCVFLFYKSWKSGILLFIFSNMVRYSISFFNDSHNFAMKYQLVTTVSNGFIFFVIVYMIMQIEKKNESLKRVVFIDTLTNMNNKRFLELYVDYFKPNSVDKDVTIMLIDVDDFKKVNGMYGKAYSDSILKDIADTIRKNTRNSDLLIREEEDNFTVLLTEMTETEAYFIASRIQTAIREKIYTHKGKETHITVSIGLKQYDHLHDLYEFLATADEALKKAKANGKDQIVSYHTDVLVKK